MALSEPGGRYKVGDKWVNAEGVPLETPAAQTPDKPEKKGAPAKGKPTK